MAEVRRIYRVSNATVSELNRTLAEISDRMDQLEGYRGSGRFLSTPTSEKEAAATKELVRKGELDAASSDLLDEISGATAGFIPAGENLSVTGYMVASSFYILAADDAETLLHGFGSIGV